ncbi:hypothetical protein KPL70_013738 [Citrus sinensis]|nr:hypothetical protein KPL70_013738 [Citrus sinensis]
MEELVNAMDANDLGMVDELGCTALHYAAVGGSIEACKALVRKKRALTQTVSNRGWTPPLSAAHCAPNDKDIVYYLSSVTTNEPPDRPFTGALAGMLAYALAAGGFHVFPVAMDSSAPWSARIGVCYYGHENCVGIVLNSWVSDIALPGLIGLCIFPLKHQTAAASSGIVEIVKMCLQMFPHTIWLLTDQQTILKAAVQHRQEKILNLVHNMVVYNKFTSPQLIDESAKDTILHLAAKLAPPAHLRIVPGVALQMQREVQWFKEVEKLEHFS